jgi:2C-methyl-D-erythritol 2,4-cyclodiphosphate synthase
VIPGSASPFFLGSSLAVGGGGAGYQVERSLRFSSSDSDPILEHILELMQMGGDILQAGLSLIMERPRMGLLGHRETS